jgi:hypothetical protein
LILLATILTCGAVLLSHTERENRELKQGLSSLYSANAEQRKLLEEKSTEIKT